MTQDDTTYDAFLGGRLHLRQPKSGFRAGVDSVLLAASVPVEAGQSILDLGCGVGAAALCLGTRVSGLILTGLELQAEYAALARQNGAALGFEVVEGDVRAMPATLKARRFDHVISNPPYFEPARGSASEDDGRELALRGSISLKDWIAAGARRVAPQGRMTVVQRAERLPELLSAMAQTLGGIEVLPLSARVGREAHLVIVTARNSARAAFKLHAPLILHRGATHLRDGEDYRAEISAVLREGAALTQFIR